MTPLETAARAAYEAWISGVEGIEPAWDDLPQDFIDRLMAAQRAALLALAECDLPRKHLTVTGPSGVRTDKDDRQGIFRVILRAIATGGNADG
jgi:hypothetical protein